MGPMLLPLALLVFGLRALKNQQAITPPAPQQQRTQPRAAPRAAPKPGPVSSAAKAAPPKYADDDPSQAAVNAAVATAVREEISRNAGPGVPASVIEPPPMPETSTAAAPAEVVRSPMQAAKDLASFLKKTGRFGSSRDRPAEVRAAQRDLKVTDDGIVGPKTRTAAQRAGVTLPLKR